MNRPRGVYLLIFMKGKDKMLKIKNYSTHTHTHTASQKHYIKTFKRGGSTYITSSLIGAKEEVETL